MDDHRIVFYITAKNIDEARFISDKLVKEKLVACVNILGSIESVYEWQGKIKNSSETALIAKTLKSCEQRVIDFINEIHSYNTPCILSFKVENGNKGFLDWIGETVKIEI